MVDETVKMVSICGFEGMLPMHEWLSDGVSLCQDEGRGFECLRSAPVVAGERPPDVLQRLVLSIRCEKEEMSDGYLLFFRMFEPCRARTV